MEEMDDDAEGDGEEDDGDGTVASTGSRRSLMSGREGEGGSVNGSLMGSVSGRDLNGFSSAPSTPLRPLLLHPDHKLMEHIDTMTTTTTDADAMSISILPTDDAMSMSISIPMNVSTTSQDEHEHENENESISNMKQRERFYTGDDYHDLDHSKLDNGSSPNRSPTRSPPKRSTPSMYDDDGLNGSMNGSMHSLWEDYQQDVWIPLSGSSGVSVGVAPRNDEFESPGRHALNLTPRRPWLEENGVPLSPMPTGTGTSSSEGTQMTGTLNNNNNGGEQQPPSLSFSTSSKAKNKLYTDILAIPTLSRHGSTGTGKQKDKLETYRKTSSKSVIQPQAIGIGGNGTGTSTSSSTRMVNVTPADRLKPSDTSQSHELVYFDSENDSTIKRLERVAPLPDREGYILGDQFLEDPRDTPLLVFVNTRSGSQQGPILKTQLRSLLNPIQVWDLADGGPEKILKSFSVLTRLRILVCGGDGTVSWIISTLDKMNLDRWPPIAILPLGTGNDLARIHGA